MKLALASDLHLEFGDIDFGNPDAAQVLILGGDILVARDVLDRHDSNMAGMTDGNARLHHFMQRCSERFAHVIYVLGNHEHYHGDFANTANHLKKKFAYISNLYILDNEICTIDDTVFIGGTLWTDMNKHDPVTIFHMKRTMNDFVCVTNSSESSQTKFMPEDAIEAHHALINFIETTVSNQQNKKFVVVSHHAPSHLSIKPRYAHDPVINGGYSSDLSNLILNNPQIVLWTHGHTHDAFDYVIGSTRVLCNPRGYIGYEQCADQWQLITVEI